MTSIEKLIEELEGSYSIIAKAVGIKKYNEIVKNAIQMHKAEIIDAFDEGQEYEYQYHINNAPKFYSETYYQETFKKD
jgi:uncharacterized protein (DUF4213/DUF364 family)